MKESTSEEEKSASDSPRSAVSTLIWRDGLAGEMGSRHRWMPKCLAIITTLLCSHLNANKEQVTWLVWLEGARGVRGDLDQSTGMGCGTGLAVEVVAADWQTRYSIPRAFVSALEHAYRPQGLEGHRGDFANNSYITHPLENAHPPDESGDVRANKKGTHPRVNRLMNSVDNNLITQMQLESI